MVVGPLPRGAPTKGDTQCRERWPSWARCAPDWCDSIDAYAPRCPSTTMYCWPRRRARREKRTAGEILSDLARQALTSKFGRRSQNLRWLNPCLIAVGGIERDQSGFVTRPCDRYERCWTSTCYWR